MRSLRNRSEGGPLPFYQFYRRKEKFFCTEKKYLDLTLLKQIQEFGNLYVQGRPFEGLNQYYWQEWVWNEVYMGIFTHFPRKPIAYHIYEKLTWIQIPVNCSCENRAKSALMSISGKDMVARRPKKYYTKLSINRYLCHITCRKHCSVRQIRAIPCNSELAISVHVKNRSQTTCP